MAGSVRIDYYDLFSSEAKVLVNNNIFVICNLGVIILFLIKCTN